MDFGAALYLHTHNPAHSGPFRGGSNGYLPYADFDKSYNPLNGDVVPTAGLSCTLSAGDTLHSVALAEWGDASRSGACRSQPDAH